MTSKGIFTFQKKKTGISIATCIHNWYSELQKIMLQGLQTARLISRCTVLLWLRREHVSYFWKPKPTRILWWKLIYINWRHWIRAIQTVASHYLKKKTCNTTRHVVYSICFSDENKQYYTTTTTHIKILI